MSSMRPSTISSLSNQVDVTFGDEELPRLHLNVWKLWERSVRRSVPSQELGIHSFIDSWSDDRLKPGWIIDIETWLLNKEIESAVPVVS